MVVIKVRIESSHSGPAGGFRQFSIEDGSPVNELIKVFCFANDVPMDPNYAIVNHANIVFDGNQSISFYGVHNNEQLYLGSTTDEGKVHNFMNWFRLAGLALFMGLLGLIICVIIFIKARDVPDSYSIVFDAGSTHTDMIAYSWPGSKINCTGQVKQLYSCTIDGGIAIVAPENVSTYLDICFGKTLSTIPKKFQKNSQIFFGATAGLRVLNETKPEQVVKLMDALKTYFKASNLEYKDENVQIISGTVEGISGWITTNYLKETLLPQVQEKQIWGSMDLGGASTQISFQVNKTALHKINSSVVFPVKLFGYEHNIFSQSFLCYGAVQAKNRYRAKLVLENTEGGTFITSPCEPIDYNVTKRASDLFGTLCFPDNNKHKKDNYTFKGSGDYENCEKHMTTLLSDEFCRQHGIKDCIDVMASSQYFVNQPFIAHSAFGYVIEDLHLPANCTQEEYIRKTKQFCNHPLGVLESINRPKEADVIPIRVLESLCFNAIYSLTLVTSVYNFSVNEWNNIHFQNAIDGSSLGWSLGYMINATESIVSPDPVPKLNLVAFILLVVLFTVFVLVSIGLTFHAIRTRKSASYERNVLKLMDTELTKFLEWDNANTILQQP